MVWEEVNRIVSTVVDKQFQARIQDFEMGGEFL